ncbi:hypothetical protein [Streptomyces globisporus]|uniref:hypothetical protein n=1 Tax=Streptomyces globisporus TaxID=1908 RepID=UPI000F4FAEAE|nr:hypothetical protein [Streptomyces globisporus]
MIFSAAPAAMLVPAPALTKLRTGMLTQNWPTRSASGSARRPAPVDRVSQPRNRSSRAPDHGGEKGP